MKVENHHDFPKFDHRSPPSHPGRFAAPSPGRALGRGRHDHLGIFQTALLGRITPASTAVASVATNSLSPAACDWRVVTATLARAVEYVEARISVPAGRWRCNPPRGIDNVTCLRS